ncbi:MAG: spore germination protein [Clostridia bacterium]|nr:spore germination protein [Clostridia bacterium]
MRGLSKSYKENVEYLDKALRVDESFDLLKKIMKIGSDEITMYYIDGFVKDGVMSKLMTYFLSLNGLGDSGEQSANDFLEAHLPYVEAEVTKDIDKMISTMLSGAALMLGSTFGETAILIDSRSYPARGTEEPGNDRVMRGARDGFVETLISNTALIRRRIRDTDLTMSYVSVGSKTKTDIAICYLNGKADAKYVEYLKDKLKNLDTGSLPMGHQSLTECLVKSRWYNPFPKIRNTERPDAAVAQILEGSVIILCDNSPEAMILPTTIFDFMQETNDFYYPPLTGSYLRLVRHLVFWSTLVLIPTWYLFIKNPEIVPSWLLFTLPKEQAEIPIIAQLLIVEFIIDGLKLASMNTPNMLANSLSIVGGLILGDFAVGVGWLIPEVILYMAYVSIATFTQTSYELGYAFKFLRVVILILTALFNYWGYAAGLLLTIALICTNKTVNRNRSYLYPLIPFNGKALLSLYVRMKKSSRS